MKCCSVFWLIWTLVRLAYVVHIIGIIFALSPSASSVYSAPGYIVHALKVDMWYLYWYTTLIDACQVICACCLHMATQGHICYWHIYGNSMVNKSCSLLFLLMCAIMFGHHVNYSSNAFGHIHAMWQAYLFRSISQ